MTESPSYAVPDEATAEDLSPATTGPAEGAGQAKPGTTFVLNSGTAAESVLRSLVRALNRLEERPRPVLAALTLVYIILTAGLMTRKLWFDELFTYYIAQSPTLGQLMDALLHVDLNPPSCYLLVRLFHALFGTSELVTRLPFTLAFYLGSVGMFFFAKRRFGVFWSAASILLFWSTPFFTFATQARPYGLLLAFFSLTLVSYDHSGGSDRPRWAVPGLLAGNVGMMLSHVFAPLSIFPFCAAEAARSVVKRRIDWKIWASLLAPVTISLAYLPAMHMFERIYFPAAYQATNEHLAYFFVRLAIIYTIPGVLAAVILAFVARPFSKAPVHAIPAGWPAICWAAGVMLAPAILNFMLMRTGGAFWDRYCLTTGISFYMLLVMALAWATGFRRSSSIAAALVFLCMALMQTRVSDSQTPSPGGIESIRTDLPLVTGSGLTFLELDRYGERGLQSRLYSLVDRNAAIEFAHSTIFENMPQLVKYFHLRSHVSAYGDFVAAHPHFLVISRPDYREEWVLKKLRRDGAKVQLVRMLHGPFKDFQLFEVQL